MQRAAHPVLLALLLLPASAVPAQTAPAPQAAPAAGSTPTATSQVGPALDKLRSTIPALRLDHWKVKGPVRDEASTNLDSIRRDLDNTLPGLLQTADAAPNSVSKNLPVYRNLDALYDVLLRVNDVARLTAPIEDATAIEDSLHTLESAQRTLGDSLQTSATLTENQLSAAQSRAQTAKSDATPAANTSQVINDGAAPATTTPHHRRRKPATTAAPTGSTTPAPAQTPQK